MSLKNLLQSEYRRIGPVGVAILAIALVGAIISAFLL